MISLGSTVFACGNCTDIISRAGMTASAEGCRGWSDDRLHQEIQPEGVGHNARCFHQECCSTRPDPACRTP